MELVDEKDEILRTKLDPFDFEKDDPIELEKMLIQSMKYYGGIGLSANQIGINARVFSMIHENQSMVLFNPELINVSEEKIRLKEGCLSFKGLYPIILRPKGVSVKFFDKNNNPMMGNFIDISARIILHEFDHLNGFTFFDRSSKFDMRNAMNKRKIILRKMKKNV
jgi:peptide deformylase